MARSNNPRRHPGQPGPNSRDPKQQKYPEKFLAPSSPVLPTPAPPLAERILDGKDVGKISAINMILGGMEEAGAKRINISNELAQAIPVVAAQLITGTKDEPATHSTKNAGAKLVLGSLKYNLDRFEEANKTELPKVENNITVNGNATFIIPAPVIGRLGETPKERE